MYCLRCKYNLQQLQRNACPECGRTFDPDQPHTYLTQSDFFLPLLGKENSLALVAWAAVNRFVAALAVLVMQLGIRVAGFTFLSMLLMIGLVEGEAGRGRTNWDNVLIAGMIILFAFYITHALIPLLRHGGARDPIRLWSYPIGVGIAILIFYSPLRP